MFLYRKVTRIHAWLNIMIQLYDSKDLKPLPDINYLVGGDRFLPLLLTLSRTRLHRCKDPFTPAIYEV